MLTTQDLTLAHLTISATPAQTIEAAAAAGFGATGIRICGRRPGDAFATPVLNNPSTISALRNQATELGVRLSNVSGYQFYPETSIDQVKPVIDATAELGVPILVANSFDPDESRFMDTFASYCELAEKAGIRVALEFLPYSGVRTLEAAWRVVQVSSCNQAGLLLDALHLARSGATPEHIRLVPAERIVFAQLCDANPFSGAMTDDALLLEARGARLPAGEGVLPLFQFLDELPVNCEIEYEVARQDMRGKTPTEKARVAAADAASFMARYHARQHGMEVL
ncbi:sugar phosphate isomerase/epimerase family protein [Advenella mimigardefordensis]|uniref:Xylose isomerase-like TIM barrel domain-containing protein n=1 Tax=Advenella mimigardefordensis (strain DSM 17166 / LMG 22922 / DPN7) TaxID=1247726 RepID=W0P9T9_ADVMD|nr:TIM barrel protein [Advenella mimigardefordensis]AHG62242.1 xylose isomerase-like TIM barrel domain-containing protein [Advenella mimigardefordensis DPN7]